MARLVISDASPLIGLALVEGLAWLPRLFGSVWIPRSVHAEVLPGFEARGARDIALALDAGWIQVWDRPITPEATALPDLDEGETDCIHLALSAAPAQALLLIDERAGRAVAVERGIRIAGSAAVIGLARKQQCIASAKACFARLHGSDFRISPAVIQAVLRELGEA